MCIKGLQSLSESKQDSDKSCQDLTRSNKINQRNGKHKPAGATCRNGSLIARPQNEGAAVSRRMASSIRSRPGGARGVFDSKREFPTCMSPSVAHLFVVFLRTLPSVSHLFGTFANCCPLCWLFTGRVLSFLYLFYLCMYLP